MMQSERGWVSRNQPLLTTLVLAAVLIASLRLPFLDNPKFQIRNADERGMFESSLAPFLGTSPTWLGWPGGLMRYAMLLTTPVTFLVDSNSEVSGNGFVRFLAEYMAHWERGVRVMRYFSLLFVAMGFASLAVPIQRLSGSRFLGVIGAVAASLVPAVFQRSMMGTADGMAFGLAAVSLAFAASERITLKHIIFSGVFIGLAMGTKITTLLLGPTILFALILAPTEGRLTRVRTILIFALTAAVSMIVADPYLLGDPLRSLKAIFGNLLMRSAQGSLADGLRVGMSYWMLLIGFGGLGVAILRENYRMAVGQIITVLLTILLVVRSPQIDPHYFAPLSAMWAVLGFGVLGGTLMKLLPPKPVFFYSASIAVVVGAGLIAVEAVREDRALLDRNKEYYAPAQWVAAQADSSPPRSRIAVPPNPMDLIAAPFTREHLERAIESEVNILFSGRIRASFAKYYGLSELPFVMLPALFNENERMGIAKLQLQLARATPEGHAIIGWTDWTALREINNAPTREDVARDFRAGKLDVLITDEQLTGLTPSATFHGGIPVRYLYCYRQPK